MISTHARETKEELIRHEKKKQKTVYEKSRQEAPEIDTSHIKNRDKKGGLLYFLPSLSLTHTFADSGRSVLRLRVCVHTIYFFAQKRKEERRKKNCWLKWWPVRYPKSLEKDTRAARTSATQKERYTCMLAEHMVSLSLVYSTWFMRRANCDDR